MNCIKYIMYTSENTLELALIYNSYTGLNIVRTFTHGMYHNNLYSRFKKKYQILYLYKTSDDFMTVWWRWVVILDGQLMWIICMIKYMGDYIGKLDDTFIYPPHPILKPIQ